MQRVIYENSFRFQIVPQRNVGYVKPEVVIKKTKDLLYQIKRAPCLGSDIIAGIQVFLTLLFV